MCRGYNEGVDYRKLYSLSPSWNLCETRGETRHGYSRLGIIPYTVSIYVYYTNIITYKLKWLHKQCTVPLNVTAHFYKLAALTIQLNRFDCEFKYFIVPLILLIVVTIAIQMVLK